jgi:hypothetical protein
MTCSGRLCVRVCVCVCVSVCVCVYDGEWMWCSPPGGLEPRCILEREREITQIMLKPGWYPELVHWSTFHPFVGSSIRKLAEGRTGVYRSGPSGTQVIPMHGTLHQLPERVLGT